MMGGDPDSEAGLAHASDLVDQTAAARASPRHHGPPPPPCEDGAPPAQDVGAVRPVRVGHPSSVSPPERSRAPSGRRPPEPRHRGRGRASGWDAAPRPTPSDVDSKPVVDTTKHIFVTGGVASSLGKGLTASSLGRLLRSRGLRVTMQKLDPYINVDPGTMNPFQHGEVFVTDDGAETDLDIGHYERFLDVNLVGSANVTTGQVYNNVIAKERRGEYLGDTVQVIPHITNEIVARMRALATGAPDAPDVIITEIGGTVGDIESLPFLEAARQVRHLIGRDNSFFLHVSLVPYLAPSGELKTKPTQHSVAALRQVGIQPDGLVLRADREIPDPIKRKISLMCDVDVEAVAAAVDAPSIYDIPKVHPPRGPRRLRHPPARTRLPRRRLDRVGPAAPARPRPRARRRGRARRQVHRPARRLPLGHRGAARRRVPPRRQGAHPLGRQRRVPDAGRRPEGARRASTRSSCPAASACVASRASSAR